MERVAGWAEEISMRYVSDVLARIWPITGSPWLGMYYHKPWTPHKSTASYLGLPKEGEIHGENYSRRRIQSFYSDGADLLSLPELMCLPGRKCCAVVPGLV